MAGSRRVLSGCQQADRIDATWCSAWCSEAWLLADCWQVWIAQDHCLGIGPTSTLVHCSFRTNVGSSLERAATFHPLWRCRLGGVAQKAVALELSAEERVGRGTTVISDLQDGSLYRWTVVGVSRKCRTGPAWPRSCSCAALDPWRCPSGARLRLQAPPRRRPACWSGCCAPLGGGRLYRLSESSAAAWTIGVR